MPCRNSSGARIATRKMFFFSFLFRTCFLLLFKQFKTKVPALSQGVNVTGEDKRWVDLSMPEKRNATLKLLDNLEIACEEKRLAAIRSFAYLCQGEQLFF